MTVTTLNNSAETKDEVKQPISIVNDSKKGIENHKQAATHHQEAAKHHLDAAKHHEAGNNEKAYESTTLANGHSVIASDYQREDAKHHALNAK
ncbi:MAG TPA: hypothetical protein VN698_13580 [Bacteroidia bacterium]|nr:hypothetical protein [Bacteroidia bacterium]